MLLVVYVRFKHVHQHCKYSERVRALYCLNLTALVFGLLSALGMITVASFQVSVVERRGEERARLLTYLYVYRELCTLYVHVRVCTQQTSMRNDVINSLWNEQETCPE